jgi:hypothetical protein
MASHELVLTKITQYEVLACLGRRTGLLYLTTSAAIPSG